MAAWRTRGRRPSTSGDLHPATSAVCCPTDGNRELRSGHNGPGSEFLESRYWIFDLIVDFSEFFRDFGPDLGSWILDPSSPSEEIFGSDSLFVNL